MSVALTNAVVASPRLDRWAAKKTRSEAVLVAGFALSTFGLLIGTKVVLVGDVVALATGLGVIARRGLLRPPARILLGCLYVVLVLYVVSSFGSNFPGGYPALLGIRKTIPPWIFLLIGVMWPGRPQGLLRRLVLLLALACGTSLAIHTFAPSVEHSIFRAANVYTALYAGSPRLQGVFAGPFHASLAGVVLIVTSLGLPALFSRRILRVTVAAIGVISVDEASVRSGWIAAFAALVVLYAVRPPGRFVTRPIRVALIVMALVVGIAANAQVIAFQNNRALESLTHWQSDSRLLNRLETYRESRVLIEQRPLLGWGPGSASDTLDRFFEGRVHVTPHNLLLSYAVEVGLVGACAVLFAIISCARLLLRDARDSEAAAVGLALLCGFVAFGATGTAVDAVPVSSFLLLFVGLCIAQCSLGHSMNRDGFSRHLLRGGRA